MQGYTGMHMLIFRSFILHKHLCKVFIQILLIRSTNQLIDMVFIHQCVKSRIFTENIVKIRKTQEKKVRENLQEIEIFSGIHVCLRP